MRRSLSDTYRTQSVAILPSSFRKCSVRLLSSISDNVNTLFDNRSTSFQSVDRDDESTKALIAETSGSLALGEAGLFNGPPDSAVKRALKNEPDDEWDFIVELQIGKIPEELSESLDDEDSSESIVSKNNEVFYDWQWKIIGTARLLEAPVGSWTQDQWFAAENILLNGWPEQHCIRAVVLQFTLLRRTCYEMEHSNYFEQQQLKLEENSAVKRSSARTSIPYNNPYDSAGDPSIIDHALDAAASERKFGTKMLSRLFYNWRNVYMLHPEVLRQCKLSPQQLLQDVLNLYCGKYNFPVSEKVFRYILVAESSHHDGCKPEFAEQVLSQCLDLYDAGMENCFPTTSLWNNVLLSWINADRKQESSNGIARITRIMDKLKVRRSRQTYRILFRDCLQRGTEQSARDAEGFLRQMYKEFLGDNFGVQPDMSSFIYVADAWAKSKSQLAGPRAEQIYEQMKVLRAKNHLLDDFDREVRLVTCVLLCYIAVGSAAAAQKAEEFYRRTGVSPDCSMYSALISLYAKNSDFVGAERIWNDMILTDVLKTTELEFSASALLDACVKANIPNKVEKAESIFSWLRSHNHKGINIDTPCYNGTFFTK
jgi:pentatricopeptide repeat protein